MNPQQKQGCDGSGKIRGMTKPIRMPATTNCLGCESCQPNRCGICNKEKCGTEIYHEHTDGYKKYCHGHSPSRNGQELSTGNGGHGHTPKKEMCGECNLPPCGHGKECKRSKMSHHWWTMCHGHEPAKPVEISLCPHCKCMTKTTVRNNCGKCGKEKPSEAIETPSVESWEEEFEEQLKYGYFSDGIGKHYMTKKPVMDFIRTLLAKRESAHHLELAREREDGATKVMEAVEKAYNENGLEECGFKMLESARSALREIKEGR